MLVRPSRVAITLLLTILIILVRSRSCQISKNPGPAPSTPVKKVHDEKHIPELYGEPRTKTAVKAIPKAAPKVAAEKAIVMGRLAEEDVSWVAEDLPDWEHHIYTVNNVTFPLHTTMNKGKEAMPYLTFIIDNYHSLPRTMAFLHSHRGGWPQAWHNDAPDYKAKNMLNTLRIDYVQDNGYVNLRCIHTPGCPGEIEMFRRPPTQPAEEEMLSVWQHFFNDIDPPRAIGTPCCAQFAVSRDRIRKRPLKDFVLYRQWLQDTELVDDTSGRIMEYLWHIIFGKEPVYCPVLEECWCEVFGRCSKYAQKKPQAESSNDAPNEISDRKNNQEVLQG